MTHGIDDELQLLQAQIIHKKRLQAILSELQQQEKPLQRKVDTLRQIKHEEQADVDRLEKRSLAAFFYFVMGKRDAMLIQEQKEAYVARMKYDAAKRELEAIRHDIEETEDDLAALGDCENHFLELLHKKSDSILASNLPEAHALLEKVQTLSLISSQIREVQEAVSAASAAMQSIHTIINCLRSAEEWSAYEVPGNFLVDVAKHEQMDTAQEAVEALQVQLQRLNKELQDVAIRDTLEVDIQEMLHFADYFYDNLFTELTVLDRITKVHLQAEETHRHLETILRQLGNNLEALRHKQTILRQERDAMIVTITL